MRLFRFLTLLLIIATGPVWAQDRSTFFNADNALQDALKGEGSLQDFFERYEDLLASGDNFNIVADGLEIIRRPDIPVVLNVSGDWGDFSARCNMTFQFVRRALSDDNFEVEGAVWGGVLEFGYAYQGETPPDTITTFDDDYVEGSFGTYAAGDFLLAPDCGSGSHLEPDYDENPRITALQEAQLACGDRLIVLVLTAPNAGIPPECVRSNSLLASLGEDIGLQEDTIALFERCILEQVESVIGGTDMSLDCVTGLRAYKDRVESALGLCDLEEVPSVSLVVIDPRPEQFKARYTYNYQRSDCKILKVTAYINAPPPDLFALTTVLPTADECLSVDYVAPGFRVTFSENIREEDLESKVRLLLQSGTTETSVPLDVALTAPNQLDIWPRGNLRPNSDYVLKLRTGFRGVRSIDNAELEVPASATGSTAPAITGSIADFEPVTWFKTTLFSDFDTREPPVSLRGAVYQVTRDANLIQDRPTATRIWLDWFPVETGATASDATFCAKFEVKDWDSSTLVHDPLVKTMKPTDSYTDDDRLHALDSANLFNWRPTPDTRDLFITAAPAIYWHAPDSNAEPPFISTRKDVIVEDRAPTNLTMKYAYLAVADFEDGLATNETALMARHMEAARQYTWQIGPFGRVSVENLGSVTPAALGVEVPWSVEGGNAAINTALTDCAVSAATTAAQVDVAVRCESPFTQRAKLARAMFETAATAFASQHCKGDPNAICYLFVPPYFGAHTDVTSAQTGRGVMVSSVVLGLNSNFMPPPTKTRSEQNRWIANGSDLAHETGHSFGLYHVPNRTGAGLRHFWEPRVVEDFQSFEQDGGRFRGIDGVRMRLDGTDGTFKSTEHGNPDTPRLLAPLMFPNLLPKGAVHILDVHYRLWLNWLNASRPVYGLGDRRFSDPDPNNPAKRVGPLIENNMTYTDIRSELISSDLAIFADNHVGELDDETRAIGYVPDDLARPVDGILTSFAVLDDDNASAVFPLLRPTRALQTPAPVIPDGPGKQFTLVAMAGTETLAKVAFRIADDTEQTISAFIPLPVEQLATLTQVALRSADDTVLFAQDVPLLPDSRSATLSQGSDGLSVLTWDTQGTGSTVTIAFEFEQNGAINRVAIGSTTDTGRFAFDLARTGISGTGTIILTFDTGITRQVISVPASLQAPFAAVTSGHEGTFDQPQLFVAFNRPLSPELPEFALLQDGQPVDVALAGYAAGALLYVDPSRPLDPCTNYTVQAQTPLYDQMGTPLTGETAWQLVTQNATDDCPVDIVVPPARLSMIRGAQIQTVEGTAEFDATTRTIRLTFPGRTLVLSAPSLTAGTYGFASVRRGDSRSEILLDYAGTPDADDQLVFTQADGRLAAQFSATLSGGQMEGAFEIVID